MKDYGVLFVCLGNICRSPLAEGVFRHLVDREGRTEDFRIDSCGTGAWHVGEPPHHDSERVAKKNGVSLAGQRARQVRKADLSRFDLIVAMDRSNRSDLLNLSSDAEDKIVCLREYDTEKGGLDVPDPYYGGADGFEEVFQIVHRSCRTLLDSLIEEIEG